MTLQFTKKTIPLRAVSVGLGDVKRIVERLIPHVKEEGHRTVAALLEKQPTSDSEYRDRLEAEREQAFRITVTIDGVEGVDGESLFGEGTEPFDSPNIPEPIASVYISNNAAFDQVAGRNPLNSFVLQLDFSTPPLVDANNPVSNPTQNFSELTVEGDRDSWVASIQEAVMGVLSKKSNGRRFMHGAFVYDIGLVLVGFPVAIYIFWRLAEVVEANLGVHSQFISAVAYIYIVIFVLNAYRVLFGYTK